MAMKLFRSHSRVGHDRYRSLPDQLVGVASVLTVEPRADRERAVGVVEQALVRAAAIDDRGPSEVVGLVDHPAAVGVRQRRSRRRDSVGGRVGVDVDAADLRVQVGELSRSDLSPRQRSEPVLHADVVLRRRAEAVADRLLLRRPGGFRVRPEDVDRRVDDRAAHAAGIGLRLVALGGGRAGAGIGGHDDVELRRLADLGVRRRGVALDVGDLVRRPGNAGPPLRRIVEVAEQQVVVEELGRGAPRVRERAGRQDPLVDARIGVGDPLLGRASRPSTRSRSCSGASRSRSIRCSFAITSDSACSDEVAVVAGVGERGRHGREAAAERVRPRPAGDPGRGRRAGTRPRRKSRGRPAACGRTGAGDGPRSIARRADRAPRSCTGRGRCSRSRRGR